MRTAMAFMSQYDNVMPIWGVQREQELAEWLSYMKDTPEMTPDIEEFIKGDREALAGDFCRGCGYCMPCPAGIMINQCARMSRLLRRAPSKAWLTPEMQAEMKESRAALTAANARRSALTSSIRRNCSARITKTTSECWQAKSRCERIFPL